MLVALDLPPLTSAAPLSFRPLLLALSRLESLLISRARGMLLLMPGKVRVCNPVALLRQDQRAVSKEAFAACFTWVTSVATAGLFVLHSEVEDSCEYTEGCVRYPDAVPVVQTSSDSHDILQSFYRILRHDFTASKPFKTSY